MRTILTFSDASGNHATHAQSYPGKLTGASHFADWTREVGRYADEANAEMTVAYCDDVDCREVDDHYPDYVWTVGPRGGLRRERV